MPCKRFSEGRLSICRLPVLVADHRIKGDTAGGDTRRSFTAGSGRSRCLLGNSQIPGTRALNVDYPRS